MSGVGCDLVVVVPDDPIRLAVAGIAGRHEALGTRPIHVEFRLETGRDPGCYQRGHLLIRHETRRCDHALVIFDQAWEGVPTGPPEELAEHVEERLRPDWGDRARCVVIVPEIEAWVFSTSPNVAWELGWASLAEMRQFLEQRGLWKQGAAKPADPKAAMAAACREKRVKPVSALFGSLAKNVSLQRCEDRSFLRLRDILQKWFPKIS